MEILPPHAGMGERCNRAYEEFVKGRDGDAAQATPGERLKNRMRFLNDEEKNDGNNLDNQEKPLPLPFRTRKSFTRKDGTHREGLEEELQRLEKELQKAENERKQVSQSNKAEEGTTLSQDDNAPGSLRHLRSSGITTLYDLRRRISLIRDELSYRDRAVERLKKEYGIKDNGDISLDNLARMFRDYNSDEQVGRMGEKTVRFTESCRAVKEDVQRDNGPISKREEWDIETREAERWSKENGLWLPYDDVDSLGVWGLNFSLFSTTDFSDFFG